MHLIFERSGGRFKSNCNILALAWMPYYDETKFRLALFDYHQRQLINLTSSIAANGGGGGPSQLNGCAGNQAAPGGAGGPLARCMQVRRSSAAANNNNQDNHQAGNPQGSNNGEFILNSRIAELKQRHRCLSDNVAHRQEEKSASRQKSGAKMMEELDHRFGKMGEFGWLVVGNVGKIVGVTLTSVVAPPPPPPPPDLVHGKRAKGEEDLMKFDDDDGAVEEQSSAKTGKPAMLASERPDRWSARTNYNLRGNLDEIILVKWNELYQKLATVDSKGNVLIWCKINDKFTIQTPFYNRTKSVADFKWSNDGKTALICYTDSFILVGSSSGQRHWHSMLNLDDYHITCASWSPNDDQLLLGVSNGNMVVIDLPHSELTELVVNRTNIRTMCWSSCEMSLKNAEPTSKTSLPQDLSSSRSSSSRRNSTVVNHRRLSRDCSVFFRYRFCSQGPNAGAQQQTSTKQESQSFVAPTRQRNILAIDLANNTIKLYDGGLDDPEPRTIDVKQESYIMQWSSDGQMLAVAGFNIHTTAPSVGCLRCRYLNEIKFYDQRGRLVHKQVLKYTRYPITAFTWAHDDARLFVATGPRLHCARVARGIPKLSLLALSCFQQNTKLPDKMDVLESIIKGGSELVENSTLVSWQSPNCPVDLANLRRKKCVQPLEDSQESNRRLRCNNSNVYLYNLPLKLKIKIDELFGLTLRQPFDEQWSLNDVVWHVPRGDHRQYCTLVCYDCDPDVGSTGHQYKSYPSRSHSSTGTDHNQHHHHQHHHHHHRHHHHHHHQSASDNKVFVLYIEFQGSLIPILRARRVGFLKPEFVIFDPEDVHSLGPQKQRKVSDMSHSQQSNFMVDSFMQQRSKENPAIDTNPQQHQSTTNSSFYYADGLPARAPNPLALDSNCTELHQQPLYHSLGATDEPRASSQFSDSEHYYNFDDDGKSRSDQSKKLVSELLMSGRSYHQEPIALPISSLNHGGAGVDPLLFYMLNLASPQVGSGKQQSSTELVAGVKALGSRHAHRVRLSRHQQTGPCLTENSEMVRIKSNIWGTKFKLVNARSNRRFRSRSTLATVVYKASILHLSPRQIFLNVKNMSNYCCLCSRHHHTRLAKRNMNANKTKTFTSSFASDRDLQRRQPVSLLDMPNLESLVTPVRRMQPGGGNKAGDKVVLQVGDTIRVAPKLEQNQSYKYASKDQACNSGHLLPSKSQSKEKKRPSKSKWSAYQYPASDTHSKQMQQTTKTKKLYRNWEPTPSTSGVMLESSSSVSQFGQDDVLTLSLGQGDQIKVEMSSLDPIPTTSAPEIAKPNQQKLDEFLAANKTLKSIQTITQMIVDLSSQANGDLDSTQREVDFSSPSKLVRLSSNENNFSPPTRYVAPETPVHRPRTPPTNLSFLSSIGHQQTQSASTTPARRHRRSRHRSASRRRSEEEKSPEMARLPPPPPPVPISRRLSTSAKRLWDGSLRSFYGGNSIQANYLTSAYITDSTDSYDNEPLVPAAFRAPGTRLKLASCDNYKQQHKSQPSTPLLGNKFKKQHSDLTSLKTQLVRKLQGQKSTQAQYGRCKGNDSSDLCDSRHSSSSSSSSLSSSSSNSLAGSPESENLFDISDSDEDDEGNESEHDKGGGRTKKKSTYSSSVRDLRDASAKYCSVEVTGERRTGGNKDSSLAKSQRRKSLCQEPNCCCAKEFKLKNRPPVWNEMSQVYQLDFGGRVTQESAKNLQIDFEGKLALQFGRIDMCTYTLDYKYPFNAVQAMAIALASLTQRLK